MADAPPASLPTPRLVGWLGRSGDSVKVRGLFVHPRHADEALRALPGLAAYQIVVSRHEHRDELTCRFVPAPDADPADLGDRISAALQEALKLRCHVERAEAIASDAKRFVDERTWE
ncbi:hypothetical protein [Oscillochloris sp. ZM17-4]|uniref:hypothetical protein n=1 Tax=Oscillochloris sp. ZM17-4 TaxID=2866714 RepID=UPI00351CDD17